MSPLIGHCLCNAGIGYATQLPSVLRRRHPVYSVFSAFHDVDRSKRRKPLKPKTSSFGFTVSELPRMDHLFRLAKQAGHDANRVFDGDFRYMRGTAHQGHEKRNRGLLPAVHPLCFKVPCSGYAQVRARRVEYCNIPRIINNIKYASLVMWTFNFCWQKITRHCIVSFIYKGVSYNARVFTSY